MGSDRKKEGNRFKFIPFADRIADINVDIFHRVSHRNEDEDSEKKSYFQLAIEKWTVLNRSKEWLEFKQLVSTGVYSLPQLLNRRVKIAEFFFEHIPKQTEHSLQPVLELLVAFVKDLRQDFYEFYPAILRELIKLLKSKNPTTIELAFVCLAFIFKYLVRNLVKDLDKVIIDLAPLLEDSLPEYIRDFAAQSFSFVARRVKDKNKFLMLILGIIQDKPELTAGCGKLVAETMHGINGQPHSSSSEMLLTIFNGFGNILFPQNLLTTFSYHVITSYITRIDPKHSNLLAILTETLKSKSLTPDDSSFMKSVKPLLTLALEAIKYRSGIHLRDPVAFVKTILTMASLGQFSLEGRKLVGKLTVQLLTAANIKLPQDVAVSLSTMILIKPDEVALNFLDNICDYGGFEATILPRVLQLFEDPQRDKCSERCMLIALAKIVIKKSYKTETWNKYHLEFRGEARTIPELVVLDRINKFNNLGCGDIEELSSYVTLLPHIAPLNQKLAINSLSKLVEKIMNDLKTADEKEKGISLSFLYVTLESLSHIKENRSDINLINLLEFLQPFYQTSLLGLKTLEILLTIIKDENIIASYEALSSARQIAITHLTSPYHKTRAIALRILIHITNLDVNSNDNELLHVLKTCEDVEMVPLTVQDYREAVKYINNLHRERVHFSNDLLEIPFRFLLGLMFTNFLLLEQPIREAIATYLGETTEAVFASLYEQLRLPGVSPLSETTEYEGISLFLAGHIKDQTLSDDRPNYGTYKIRLWKTLGAYPVSDEKHVTALIDMALEFFRSQVMRVSWQYAPLSIKQNLPVGSSLIHEDRDDDADDNETEESKGEGSSPLPLPKTLIHETLNVLTILRSKYREDEVRNLCMDLMSDLDNQTRKGAIECLLSRRSKKFQIYKAKLLKFVDDSGFKDTLVHFQIDKDSGALEEAHRPTLMPIILRLLYSKMIVGGPTHRGNKSSATSLRRSMVMRFLSGCHQNEIEEFLKMAFRDFNVTVNSEKPFGVNLIDRMSNVQLDAVIHPRKVISAINLVEVVLEHLGGLLCDRLQRFLIYIILSAAAIAAGCLQKREEIHSGYLVSLKKLRGMCLLMLAKVFDKFPKFNWLESDVDALFRICIWPIADRLHMEGIHSPTPLLKLFSVWADNPRYFQLLIRLEDNDHMKTPLSVVMELLLNENCQKQVREAITMTLEKLLTLREDEPMETDGPGIEPIRIQSLRPIDLEAISKLVVKDELNYGTKILFPHVGSILEYLRRRLAKSEKKQLSRIDTVVLARITELATSSEHGDKLVGLLLRILVTRPPSDDEALFNTLVTVKHLLAVVSEPILYIGTLAQLFSSIELVQGRKVLISCLEDLSLRHESFKDIWEIIRDLNAFDRRWIDQCDFNKRLDTFKKIRELATDNKLSTNLALFIIHTSFFFLRFEKDLSLRDSTELCLKEICPAILVLAKDSVNDRSLISETLLRLIRIGIQGKEDRFKASAISLLGVLARKSAASHFVFRDLSVLSNESDLEVDFFENIHHLQIYRRLRALHKFTAVVKTLKRSLSPRTMTQFILPLATQFLCNETFAGKNTLVDGAIEYVGMACRMLPWHQYQSVLRYYLLKLRTDLIFQRQCVRLVIAILDSFHFDLCRLDEKLEISMPMETDAKDEETGSEKGVTEEDKIENEDSIILPVESMVNDADGEVEDDATMEVEGIPAVEVTSILKPAVAVRVQRTISGNLLELLHKAIGQRTRSEISHKLNRKSFGTDKDEEDILRVPIAVALVKLLQKLPGNILELQLPGIFMKLCTFLKSHLESVRRVTRETLQQIMTSLGPSRLPLLLSEMTGLLTKGFQVHVLVFTIHAVIQALQPALNPGDLDECLPTVLKVCNADLFGVASEEKEVVRMKVKHKEVRSNKSFNLLHMVAQYITEKCLMDLILPIKEVLLTNQSSKIHAQCRECLRQIVLGLSMNSFILPVSLFAFSHGVISESIPQLKPVSPPQIKKANPKERPNTLLLASEPYSRSISVPVNKNTRAGAHLIVEFGLHLLMILLKQDKVKSIDLRPFLDPLTPVLRSALDSQHVKVTTLAIKCLSRCLRYDLPSLREHIKSITDKIFFLLHKFAAAGLSKGDNFDLVLASFKIISVITRDVTCYTLTPEQLKALLLYAEQDINDGSRQAVAFGVLKSILQRRLITDELHGVMLKVAQLSICCEQAHARNQARQTVLQYIMEYPLGKKIEDLIGFYIGQLSYSVESGRQSALEMIFSFINSFPEKTLKEQCGLFFLTLGTQLANDDSPDCKRMVATVLKGLLAKLDVVARDNLFEMIVIWLKQKKMSHRRLAAQLAGIFVAFEKEQFERRLLEILPLLKTQFLGDRKPGRFVLLACGVENNDTSANDQLLYLVLTLLVKICANCPKILSSDLYVSQMALFVDVAQGLLCHEHEWVRVGACQFLGSVLSAIKPSEMAAALKGHDVTARFWSNDTIREKVKSLILDHTSQFVPGVELNQDFTDQIMKNLVYFAKVLKDVHTTNSNLEKDVPEDSEVEMTSVSLLWLVRRMRRLVNLEVAHTPGNYSIRTAVLMWTGAVTVCLSKEEIMPVLYNLAAPVVREEEIARSDSSKHPIAELVNDVAAKLKKKVGVDVYAEQTVKLLSKLMERRAKRRSAIAQEFVSNPERAVKRKIEKQLKKKENKKLKKEILKGKKVVKYKGKKRKVK